MAKVQTLKMKQECLQWFILQPIDETTLNIVTFFLHHPDVLERVVFVKEKQKEMFHWLLHLPTSEVVGEFFFQYNQRVEDKVTRQAITNPDIVLSMLDVLVEKDSELYIYLDVSNARKHPFEENLAINNLPMKTKEEKARGMAREKQETPKKRKKKVPLTPEQKEDKLYVEKMIYYKEMEYRRTYLRNQIDVALDTNNEELFQETMRKLKSCEAILLESFVEIAELGFLTM